MGPGRGRSGRPQAQEATLSIRLLGGVDLRLDGVRIPSLDSARAESLLAYLLLHRDAPQQCQHLAFMLWPDSTEPQARTNLRHVLHNLRRALPEADRLIDVGPRTLQWRPEARLWLDVAAFEDAVADGRLKEAVDLYAGDLLEGNYDDWLLEERERLAELHLEALERLTAGLEERGELTDAIRYSERLLRHDPLREETYRLLMRLRAAAGDRARALRTYHLCEATLQRELGIEPSPATRKAYESLLPGTLEPTEEQAAIAPSQAAALVGRADERARLAALWRTVEEGGSQLALVTGEPGIGKTRLVAELRSWCAHRGAVTVEARAYPAEGTIAYGAVATWLRSEPIASRLRRLDQVQLTELARILPELLVEIPDLPRPEPLSEGEQRQRLYGAVRSAMLAAGAPLLLVADDLQWFDVPSLQFAHYLLRAAPDARVLVAATARREEIDSGHPVNELITALGALGRIAEIGLERLSRDETGLLAERITGTPPAAADAARLYEESEGNPLFVVEALRAADPGAPRESGKVGAVIAARLAQLSASAAELAGVAATIGREFTAQVLADASGAGEQALVRNLDELWRRGLVRAQGPSAYDFSHGKIREAAYLALGPEQARYHHRRVAEALERSHAPDPDPASAQIAAHYAAAGAAREAVAWYARAAEAAQRLYANVDAVRSLERALDLVRGLGDGRGRAASELELLTALPAPLVAVEGYLSDRVDEVHARALELAEGLGVEPEPPLVRSLALATLTRGEFEAARPIGSRLRRRAEEDGDEVLWVESAYVLGVAEYWQGHLEAARAQFEAAVERCRPEHRAAHLLRYGQDPEVFCLMRLAHTLWLLGRAAEAERKRDAALEIASRPGGDPYSRTAATAWAAIFALDQCDEEGLRRHTEAFLGDERVPETAPTRVVGEAFAGLIDALDGRGDGIERASRVLAETRTRPPAPGANGVLMRIVVAAHASAGNPKAGLEAADEALETGGGTQLWESELRRLRAGFLASLGAPLGEVEAELGRAIEVADRQGARPFARRARESLTHLRGGTP